MNKAGENALTISITFKTPDAADFALEVVEDDLKEGVREKLSMWIKYNESITVEFDLMNMKATVVTQGNKWSR